MEVKRKRGEVEVKREREKGVERVLEIIGKGGCRDGEKERGKKRKETWENEEGEKETIGV